MTIYCTSIVLHLVKTPMLQIIVVAAGMAVCHIRAQSLAQPVHPLTLEVAGRAFTGHTEGHYGSAKLTYAYNSTLSLSLLGSTGLVDTTQGPAQTIFFGGREGELRGVYHEASTALDIGVGILAPTTFAHRSWAFTYNLSRTLDKITPGLRLSVLGVEGPNPSAGLRADYIRPLAPNWSVNLQGTTLIRGNTTMSTNTGQSVRHFLWAASLDYRVNETQALKVGLTNVLGDTTAMTLADPVGNTYGLVIGYQVKF